MLHQAVALQLLNLSHIYMCAGLQEKPSAILAAFEDVLRAKATALADAGKAEQLHSCCVLLWCGLTGPARCREGTDCREASLLVLAKARRSHGRLLQACGSLMIGGRSHCIMYRLQSIAAA